MHFSESNPNDYNGNPGLEHEQWIKSILIYCFL